MESGVLIEGIQTKPASVTVLGPDRFRVTLTEGKKHQIRRMVVALFNEVKDLKRVSIMNITLGSLADGEYRPLTPDETTTFLSSLGL
jgi:pseudouridine synthase